MSRRRCGENSATNSATWRQTSSNLGSLISSQHPASWLFPFVLPAPCHSTGSEIFEASTAPACLPLLASERAGEGGCSFYREGEGLRGNTSSKAIPRKLTASGACSYPSSVSVPHRLAPPVGFCSDRGYNSPAFFGRALTCWPWNPGVDRSVMLTIHRVKRQELTRSPWGPPSGWGQAKEMPVGEAMKRMGMGGQPPFRGAILRQKSHRVGTISKVGNQNDHLARIWPNACDPRVHVPPQNTPAGWDKV